MDSCRTQLIKAKGLNDELLNELGEAYMNMSNNAIESSNKMLAQAKEIYELKQELITNKQERIK